MGFFVVFFPKGRVREEKEVNTLWHPPPSWHPRLAVEADQGLGTVQWWLALPVAVLLSPASVTHNHRVAHTTEELHILPKTYIHNYRVAHTTTELHTQPQTYMHNHRVEHIATELHTQPQSCAHNNRLTHTTTDLHTQPQSCTCLLYTSDAADDC